MSNGASAMLPFPPPRFERIQKSIAALAPNPRPPGAKKLSGESGYRVRVGDYRVLYECFHAFLHCLRFSTFVWRDANRSWLSCFT